MSVSQSWSPQVAVKLRSTRSSWTGGPALRVRPRFLAKTDQMPYSDQMRHTRRSLTWWPTSMSSSAMKR